ncbi:MAG: protein kinase, partial [bacterium]
CRERFLNEAHKAARLANTNIITISEDGEYRKRPFISMEYVRGESLGTRLTEQELTYEEILNLVAQVADALTAAHSQGVIHRDIKPSNIMIDTQGRVKLVDFGVAAACEMEKLAESGLMMGTIGYMSPEQIMASAVDERSDLFSLGIVFYEMITRKSPFPGDSHFSGVRAALDREPRPLTEFRDDVPAEIAGIIGSLLRKNPDQRYQHADLLQADLRTALANLTHREGSSSRRGSMRKPSVAVLPFTNLSGEKEQDYFCEGMAEETINALTKVRGLDVAGRGAAFALKGETDLLGIGRKLKVDHLLGGSIQKAGEQLRISVQLTDINSGYQLWSDHYDRKVEDLFRIQDEIAESVVKALRVILNEDEKEAIAKLYTDNLEAYDLYLRGRQFFNQGRRKSLQFARQLFEQACELDPNYALAHAGVADCCSNLVHWYGDRDKEVIELAERASRRALELEPDSPDTRTSRGFALWVTGRLREADEQFATAIKLDPAHHNAHYFYGRACFQQGRLGAAVRLFEQACEIQESHEARYFAAQTYSALEQPENAVVAYRQAVQAVRRYLELNPGDARAVTIGAVCLCRLGEQERGLEWAERALAIDLEDAGVRYNVACLFSLAGRADRALDCLEQAFAAGFGNIEWLDNDPDLKPLRGLPRFRALMDNHRVTQQTGG